jgi:polyisoprenoid-binding protein YceI
MTTKTQISFSSLAAGLALLMSSFTRATHDETFTVDTKRSSIQWLAKKVTGQHNGTIKLASGQLTVHNQAIKDGTFTLEMASIACSDLEGESNKKIIAHLKSDDFFSVEKNPTSKFQITKIALAGIDRVNISGNLTIKNITKPLTFTAAIKQQGNELTATAKNVKVDRTKYDIKYGSKSFFSSMGDKAIDNEFELTIKLVATK